jgi:hypothetical protein
MKAEILTLFLKIAALYRHRRFKVLIEILYFL